MPVLVAHGQAAPPKVAPPKVIPPKVVPQKPAQPPVQKAPAKPTAKTPAATKPAAKRTASAAPAAPHIIVLLVDDLGWQDHAVPLYRDTTAANRGHLTPAIARLAREGVAFTNAYASAPVGTPSLVTLLTGRGPALTRVTDDSLSTGRDRSRTVPGLLAPAWHYAGLSGTPSVANSASAPLLPKLLRTAGYRTAYVGTPRWSAANTPGSDGWAIGFDESSAASRSPDSVDHFAIRAIDAARAANTPSFVLVAFEPPPEQTSDPGAALQLRPRRASDIAAAVEIHRRHIESVDTRIGRVLAHIDSVLTAERALVILLSDNGGRAPMSYPNAPLRGRMGSAYEGGLRIPLMVRWPSVAQRGVQRATPVIIDDLFPTLLRAARVPNVTVPLRGATGRDLTSTLDGSRPLPADRALLWHYPHAGEPANDGAEPFSALRAGPWKLIYFYANSRYELYHVIDDVGESRELSLRRPDVAAPLSESLRAALRAANAQMPVDSVYGRALGLPGRILRVER